MKPQVDADQPRKTQHSNRRGQKSTAPAHPSPDEESIGRGQRVKRRPCRYSDADEGTAFEDEPPLPARRRRKSEPPAAIADRAAPATKNLVTEVACTELLRPWEDGADEAPVSRLYGMVERPGVQSVGGNIVDCADMQNSLLLDATGATQDVLDAYAEEPLLVQQDIGTLKSLVRRDPKATAEDIRAVDDEVDAFVGKLARGDGKPALEQMRAFIATLLALSLVGRWEKCVPLSERSLHVLTACAN